MRLAYLGYRQTGTDANVAYHLPRPEVLGELNAKMQSDSMQGNLKLAICI